MGWVGTTIPTWRQLSKTSLVCSKIEMIAISINMGGYTIRSKKNPHVIKSNGLFKLNGHEIKLTC
jgi:hypothetical protein